MRERDRVLLRPVELGKLRLAVDEVFQVVEAELGRVEQQLVITVRLHVVIEPLHDIEVAQRDRVTRDLMVRPVLREGDVPHQRIGDAERGVLVQVRAVRLGQLQDVRQRLVRRIRRVQLLDKEMRHGGILPQRDERLQVRRIGDLVRVGNTQLDPKQLVQAGLKIGVGKNARAVALVRRLELRLQRIRSLRPRVRRRILGPPCLQCAVIPRGQAPGVQQRRRAAEQGESSQRNREVLAHKAAVVPSDGATMGYFLAVVFFSAARLAMMRSFLAARFTRLRTFLRPG